MSRSRRSPNGPREKRQRAEPASDRSQDQRRSPRAGQIIHKPPAGREHRQQRLSRSANPALGKAKTCARALPSCGEARTALASKNGGVVTANQANSVSLASRRALESSTSSRRRRIRDWKPVSGAASLFG